MAGPKKSGIANRPNIRQSRQSDSSSEGSVIPTVHPMDQELESLIETLHVTNTLEEQDDWGQLKELETVPLFSLSVRRAAERLADEMNQTSSSSDSGDFPISSSRVASNPFVQYGLLGHEPEKAHFNETHTTIDPIFLNTNAPWSAFICGVQGSGKSHTLSCMLENCLLPQEHMKPYGRLSKPLSGIVFHYDNNAFAGPCEAAYLCSTGIKVNVIMSPSNETKLKDTYANVPKTKKGMKLFPLKLRPEHLSADRMMKIMAFHQKDGAVPLYMEVCDIVIRQILKEMVRRKPGPINFRTFELLLAQEKFTKEQSGPMNMRLSLLKNLLDTSKEGDDSNVFAPAPGTLTIVDLTDPFIDAASACVLFDVCLSIFMETPTKAGRVVALDEAHKYLNTSSKGAADNFTSSLLRGIRLQRHIATRFIIATQEPTVSPALLDLCSISIIHRFSSPAWFSTIRQHLGGASDLITSDSTDEHKGEKTSLKVLNDIVSLKVGEALLFAPSAALDASHGKISRLGMDYVKFKTRPRVSADGGMSRLAITQK